MRLYPVPGEGYYKDTGCKLYPSCLNCPRARCIHDEPEFETLIRMAKEQKEQGLTLEESARLLNRSSRTVLRLRKA